MFSLPVIVALILAVAYISSKWIFRPAAANYLKGVKELPGPKGYPLVGNLPDIPPVHSWLKFFSWSRTYGPIYQISLAGTPHVVISSEQIANTLMRERGNLYSDRDQAPMAAHLLSDNLRPLLLPYGETWREFRKFSHSVAASTVAANYQPLQEDESLRMLHDLMSNPIDYKFFFERYAGSVIMRLAFGITIYTAHDPYLIRIIDVLENLERVVSPGAYLVDIFPSLMYLPDFLAPFKREGKRLHAEEFDLFTSLVADVRGRKDKGDPTAEGTFAARWLEHKSEYNLSDAHAAYVVGTLYEAASGTTSMAMGSFMLAMVLHPEKYRKLCEEVDNVVSDNRLPSFADLPRLPYVRACVKETLRWRPVTAGGIPHKLTARDDVYDGSLIPKGSLVHANQWAIHREESLYPQPEEFIPERWLEEGWPTYREPLTQYPNLNNYSAFGFGRRICPGQAIAERSLHIQTMMIAWGCEVGKKIQGDEIKYGYYEGLLRDYKYTKGFNTQPEPFDFELKPRKGRDALVRERFGQAWGERIRANAETKE